MFTTVSILLVILAGLCTALYKVTYPTCTARRCGHGHTRREVWTVYRESDNQAVGTVDVVA